MAEAPSFTLTGQVLGRYELRTALGAGGFGEVYRAWDRLDDVEVAVKVLQVPDYLNAAAREVFIGKFQEEAKLTRKIFRGRTNVRQVFDMGVHEGTRRPWMAMELLEGETLEDQLERRRTSNAPPRSEAEALAFIRPVLVELAFAHEHGVVHRDIKPANIFVANTPGGPILKVLDFGIAKIVEAEESTSGNTMTSSALQMFSPHYGSPEQFAGKKTGKYTDVFALGLLLTELLTDQPPLGAGERFEQLQISVDKRDRPTPKAKGRVVAPAFEAAILRSVSVVATERQPDAGTLLRELDAALSSVGTAPTVASPAHPKPTASGTEFAQPLPAPVPAAVTRSVSGGTVIGTEIAHPALVPVSPPPAAKSANKGLIVGIGAAAALAVIGFAIANGQPTRKTPVTPLVLASASAEAAPSASASVATQEPLQAMPEEPSAAAVDAAPLAVAQPGDDMLGSYSCTVTEVANHNATTYDCIIKRDDKGKLVLQKTCCSWTWYFYLSNVTDSGFTGAGAAQVDMGWKAASGRGTFTRTSPDRITGRVHTVNGEHGKYGEWDDDVVLTRRK